MGRKTTVEEFRRRAGIKHNFLYDYSLVEYSHGDTDVRIICKEHGIFLQSPNRHLHGAGCRKCGTERAANKNRKTNEQFIEKSKILHGDRYEYSLIEYINNVTKVNIICHIHGIFKMNPTCHLEGRGCQECSKIISGISKTKTHKNFLKDALIKHLDRYDYTKTKYVDSREKVIITCKKHGDFEQTPISHTQGAGCRKCANAEGNGNVRYTLEDFKEKAVTKHSNYYNYDKVIYINNATKITITCKEHGYFEQVAGNHLQGAGCKLCKNKRTSERLKKNTEQFIKEALETHRGMYNYDKVEYIDAKTKVIINCKIHGDFEQIAGNHLYGAGCEKCAFSNRIGIFSRASYIEQARGRTCIFYTLRCFNENEEFYKIGITMNSVEQRYCGILSMPYSYEVISEVKGSADFIWDLEQFEKKKLKSINYQPSIPFAGSKTECFTKYKL
jgi:hypothetical protein